MSNLATSARMALALVLVLLLGSCSRPVAIDEPVISDKGLQLTFAIKTCLGDHAIDITEDDEAVVVNVADRRLLTLGGGDCLDGATVRLAEPFGDRDLVDGSTGQALDVRHEPWNQTRFTEDEFRRAVEAAVDCMLDVDPDLDARVAERSDGPYPSVNIPDIPDGGSFDGRFIGDCIDEHIEPLRR